MMSINDMICKMIAECNGHTRDIGHFLKVYTYARLIGEKEQLDPRTQQTLEIAAVIHDIACPLCRIKYGSLNGKYQEQESAPLVEAFLEDAGVDEEMKKRISFLVCHHHTYTGVDGVDYRILLEADYLENAYENNLSKEAIVHARDTFFETKTGIELLEKMFLTE